MVYKLFDKNSAATNANNSATHKVTGIDSENQQIANELHKPRIKRIRSSFKDNIWSADLADMQLISKYNKRNWFYFLLLIFLVNMHGLFL